MNDYDLNISPKFDYEQNPFMGNMLNAHFCAQLRCSFIHSSASGIDLILMKLVVHDHSLKISAMFDYEQNPCMLNDVIEQLSSLSCNRDKSLETEWI